MRKNWLQNCSYGEPKMKIAITGGRGFVGKYFLKLLGQHYECIVLGRGEEDRSSNGQKISYIQTTYEKEKLIHQLQGVQAVVHMAGKRYESNEQMSDYCTSIEASSNLFEACAALNITNIVFLSSLAVYGISSESPWREESETLPVTFYGISKLSIEKMADYYNHKYHLNIKNLRLAQIVGLGEREGYIVTTFINRAIHKKKLELWGEGKGRRNYIYIIDDISAIQKALENNKIKGTFNICLNRNTSHREFAEIINNAFNNIGNLVFIKKIDEDQMNYFMSNNKANHILGWRPKWTLQEASIDMKKTLNL